MNTNSDNSSARKERIAVLIALAVAAFLATLFNSCLSPLFSIVPCLDQCCFARAGQAICSGMVPYLDFIDVKGPLLFLLYGAGYALTPNSTTGIWLIETLSLFFTLYFTYRLARLFISGRGAACSAAVLCLFYILQRELYADGGRAEMFTGCAFACVLWWSVRLCMVEDWRRECRGFALAMGIAFSSCFFIKHNAIVPPAAALGLVSLALLVRREWKAFARLTAFGVLGCAVVAVPMLAYMVCSGNLLAFYEVMFKFNPVPSVGLDTVHVVMYAGKLLQDPCTTFALVSLPCLWLDPWKRLSRLNRAGLLLTALLAFASAFIGNYPYYLLYCTPLSVIPAVVLVSHLRIAARPVGLLACTVCLTLFCIRANPAWHYKSHFRVTQSMVPSLQAMEDEVSAHPGSTIMFLGCLDTGFGLESGVLPACPEWFGINDAPASFVRKQLAAVTARKADYVVIPEHTVQSYGRLLEQNGYREVSRTNGEETASLYYYLIGSRLLCVLYRKE